MMRPPHRLSGVGFMSEAAVGEVRHRVGRGRGGARGGGGRGVGGAASPGAAGRGPRERPGRGVIAHKFGRGRASRTTESL
ncbi:hypothetical protein EMIHUDRAFT_460805 [Emiliania huxleyi CCMP1516]|uniref:Uncharacterized protein n=2 Tax=Emiliania huxleyi TaxID=2903 RepID=A0A0D3J4X3_EMIH1|nr:hypothetical protein EMIHUDRAFT_460805 [Emiliania huxleyi CCMP1516]EOD18558.1 hypothetical protein EMIHUDRAFT_460805 [Emiliania huxleyi CCMP1516]|eukprot:XP_005770987.1 hypothetical protein EMIHUDRAFT_460805 [Emiliania huxleyi CCMP1516]